MLISEIIQELEIIKSKIGDVKCFKIDYASLSFDESEIDSVFYYCEHKLIKDMDDNIIVDEDRTYINI